MKGLVDGVGGGNGGGGGQGRHMCSVNKVHQQHIRHTDR